MYDYDCDSKQFKGLKKVIKIMYLLWLMWALNFFKVSAEVSSSPPVLIWGMKTPEIKTIFRPVRNHQFYLLLRKIQKDHMIMMYFASELAAKDFNCVPCFPNLRLIEPMNYYSQVEEPLEALRKVGEKTKRIIWHKPTIINETRLGVKMRVPCQTGHIHAFDFSDRQLIAHDHAMAVAHYQLSDLRGCRVVQVYTALTEEKKSYQRRKLHYVDLEARKPQIVRPRGGSGNLAPQLSYTNTSNTSRLTILRSEEAIVGFKEIMLATKESTWKSAPIIRSTLTVLESDLSMQVGLYNKPDLDAGLVLLLDTNHGPLGIEVLPVTDSWYLSRAILDETIFYPTDRIFFSSDFSLCCGDVNFFAKNKSLLSLFDFYLDIVTSVDQNGMELMYEAKPCWSCSQFLTPTLIQTLVVMFIFVAILWIGLTFITSIGRNELVQVAADPDLYIKTDQ